MLAFGEANEDRKFLTLATGVQRTGEAPCLIARIREDPDPCITKVGKGMAEI
jgi:hypothetical protein